MTSLPDHGSEEFDGVAFLQRAVAFYPAVFAAYPVATLWAANVGMVSPVYAMAVAVTLFLAAVTLQLLIHAAGIGLRQASFVVLTLVAGLYGLQRMAGFVGRELPVGRTMTWFPWALSGLFLVMFWGGLRLADRTMGRRGLSLVHVLSLAALIALALPIFRATAAHFGPLPDLVKSRPTMRADRDSQVDRGKGNAPLPDVYWIVLDGYTRADVLQSHFGFDNSPFLSFLEDKEFHLGDGDTWANYVRTDLTIASMLHASYVDSADVNAATAQRTLGKLIDHPWLFRVFRRAGYNIHTIRAVPYRNVFPDGFGSSATKSTIVKELLLSPLVHGLLRHTVFGGLAVGGLADVHRQHLLRGFEQLAALSETQEPSRRRDNSEGSPRFFYAHFLLPHQPFVFKADGSLRPPQLGSFRLWYGVSEGRSPRDYVDGYIHQVRFTNARLQALLTTILASASRPVAIVLMGDHGSALGLHPRDVNATDLKERLAILAALRLPGCDRGSAVTPIFPVRIARTLVRCYVDPTVNHVSLQAFYSPVDRPTAYRKVTFKPTGGPHTH